jgi:hypothetical protein
MCETCANVTASFGMPDAPTRRWCARCAKAQPGAVRVKAMPPTKMCEDCDKVGASFGMADEPGKWWCAGCARKNHPGAVNKSYAKNRTGRKRKRR